MDAGRPLLQVTEAGLSFGGVRALDGVSFSVPEGGICGLVGPNGAGKTTLFNCVTRLHRLARGEITFAGRSLAATHRRDVVRLGIARTFQNLGIFPDLTVADNVLVGAHHRRRDRFFTPLLRPGLAAAEERRAAGACREILAELELTDVAGRRAGDLPYGTLKRLEVARALAAAPKLLLLDEPAAGLTQGDVAAFGAMLLRVKARFALTILLVEHNMRLVMSVCERIVVMHLGRKLAEGTPAEIQADELVVAVYLGRAPA